MRYSKA